MQWCFGKFYGKAVWYFFNWQTLAWWNWALRLCRDKEWDKATTFRTQKDPQQPDPVENVDSGWDG